ncbi:hypothetical protein [Candidatus Borreliella tachyglossi]|nr:hypothetical protein [Candidatus Borreliella tachyglossi]
MLLYRDIFGIFVLFLMLINVFVIVSYLKYFYEIDFKGNKIFYKKFYSKLNFSFDDILWIEKRLLDNMLILTLNNMQKVKVCFLRKDYLVGFFRKLKAIRADLFIVKVQEFPKRYYVSGSYVTMLLFRILSSLFIYYVSFDNIIIFLLILLIDIKALICEVLGMKNLVVFYEFREDSICERKLFSKREYFYKFFDNVLVNSSKVDIDDDYLSFVYNHQGKGKKIYISDHRMSYSMQKAFAYVDRYCNRLT